MLKAWIFPGNFFVCVPKRLEKLQPVLPQVVAVTMDYLGWTELHLLAGCLLFLFLFYLGLQPWGWGHPYPGGCFPSAAVTQNTLAGKQPSQTHQEGHFTNLSSIYQSVN